MLIVLFKKLARKIMCSGDIRKKMNLETKKLIYESFVRMHLLYWLLIRGSAKTNIIKP
jgi:hypothetical protein